jgi:hypothetical protein
MAIVFLPALHPADCVESCNTCRNAVDQRVASTCFRMGLSAFEMIETPRCECITTSECC